MPVVGKRIEVALRDAAAQVAVDVLQVFGLGAVDVARQVIVEDGQRRSRSTLELVLLQLRNLAAQGNVQAFRAYNALIAKYSPQETERRGGYLIVPKAAASPEEWEREWGVKLRAHQRRLAEEAEREGTPCDRRSVGELG